ncbi:hypothetical protein EZV73_11480 [Acidaminobacter sp. JC074]|uniref:hypothetical protein n=1 Tax=Acidaminobacter sp. JC074 TaxID=2530199 RepID=UPI001F1155C5|nr:hypothetical protein [Acidaminobacter sp. JC074]MCH4888199.1 hypothetical protein [Acidaminobacter sp. JC074]
MVEKAKLKEEKVLDVLDDIGCGCGSCEDDHKHDHKHDHGHDHSHEITMDFVTSNHDNPLDDIGCG